MKYSGIGGQAVMEGVMMRNGSKYAVAVRKSNGEIVTKEFPCGSPDNFWHKCPIIRGITSFVESLSMGMSTLTYSASFFEEEDNKNEGPLTDEQLKKKEKKEKIEMGFTVFFAVILAVGLFFLFPYFVSSLIKKHIESYALFALIEGAFRMALFLGYVWAISFMEDIKRMFMYHGAEHKCINCLESGLELTVDNVRKSSKHHKRCGTSFIFIVFLLSVFAFMFIRIDNNLLQLGCRLLLIPVIAGVSYEFIRIAGRSENKLVSFLSKPGMFVQRLTTKEPDDEMIEVGIASVEAIYDWREFLANYDKKEV